MISPCVRICTMDPESGLCEGCGRRIDEIASWLTMTDEERRAIMDALPARLAEKRAREAAHPAGRQPGLMERLRLRRAARRSSPGV